VKGRSAPFLLGGAALLPVAGLLLVVLWMGFWEGGAGEPVRYTLKHYRRLFGDPFTYGSLLNTLAFALITVAVSLGFAVPAAWLVERTDLPGKGIVFTLMTVSALVPTFFTAMGWVFLLHPRIGVLNRLLGEGLGLGPLNVASIPGMGWVEGLGLSSLAFMMVVAAYRAMDPSLEEAARVHGLNLARTLRYVTLPLTLPSIVAAAIYLFTIGIAAFEVPAIIGLSNKIFTFATFVFYQMHPLEELPNYGLAGAVSTLMMALALLLSWLYFRVLGDARRYAVITGRGYRPKLVELGRWWVAAWLFLALFFLVAKLLPLALLVWASLLAYFQPPSMAALSQISLGNFYALPWPLLLRGARNTLLLMLSVPTLALIFCLGISWVIVRSGKRWRFLFDAAAFLPHALPNIILAVAAAFAALFLLPGALSLYGTLAILVVVYTLSRISFATRVLNNALAQVHPELEEAAYAGGLSLLKTFQKILVPLLRPSLVYAWLWMALLTFRELTMASVLVTGQNNVTLPVIVWGIWLGGSLNQAAAANVVILSFMLPLVLLYWRFARGAEAEEGL
jgi:iron(III) transport system permease protein